LARAYRFFVAALTALALYVSLGVVAFSPALADVPAPRTGRASARPFAERAPPTAATETQPAPPAASAPTESADTLPQRHVEVGEATWYGDEFHGRPTASGELMDQAAFVAAHPDHPFGTYLRVTNQHNGKSVVVRVVDRGPNAPGKLLPAVVDLSRAAANAIDMLAEGRVFVTVEVVAAPGK
jgi:rare lipoprotein A